MWSRHLVFDVLFLGIMFLLLCAHPVRRVTRWRSNVSCTASTRVEHVGVLQGVLLQTVLLDFGIAYSSAVRWVA